MDGAKLEATLQGIQHQVCGLAPKDELVVLEVGGNYLLTVRKNQPTLLANIRKKVAALQADFPPPAHPMPKPGCASTARAGESKAVCTSTSRELAVGEREGKKREMFVELRIGYDLRRASLY